LPPDDPDGRRDGASPRPDERCLPRGRPRGDHAGRAGHPPLAISRRRPRPRRGRGTSPRRRPNRRRASRSCGPPLLRGELHRLDDLRVRGAAAQVAREIVADLVVRRIGIFLEQLARHQHEPRRAEAALEGLRLDESLLDGVEALAALDGRQFRAFQQRGELQATRDRAAVHEHRAAAAQALAAALARPVQPEAVAQHLDDVLVRRDLRLHRLAVQPEADGFPHFASPPKTASAVSGSEVSRTPTASSSAFATAGETPNVPVSPTPLAPKGSLRCSALTVSFTISPGRSSIPGILYSASEGLRSWPCSSKSIFSKSVKPSCMIAAPESCVSTIFGLIGVPTSATFTRR